MPSRTANKKDAKRVKATEKKKAKRQAKTQLKIERAERLQTASAAKRAAAVEEQWGKCVVASRLLGS